LRRRLVDHYSDDPDVSREPPAFSGAALYWLVLLAVTVLAAFGLYFAYPEGPLVTVIVLALGLPLLQLGASVVSFIVLALWQRPDQLAQVGQVGKITIGTVIGAIVGIVLMVALGILAALLAGLFK
jgi:hypothetical protein